MATPLASAARTPRIAGRPWSWAYLRALLELNLRTMRARAYVRVVASLRELMWILWEVMLPFMATAAYVFVYRALDAPPAFLGFVILGGTMTAFWMNVLWGMASQFYWERYSGQLELFFASPASLMAILMGMAVGGMFQAGVRALGVLVLGSLAFRVEYAVGHPWLLAYAFFITLWALYGLGMLLASVFLLYGREAWHTSNLLQEPVYLLSGFYFPVRALGFWVAAGATVIPLTLGLDAMRQLAFGGGPWAVAPDAVGLVAPAWEVLALTVMALVFIAGAYKALGRMMWAAKVAGTLALKH